MQELTLGTLLAVFEQMFGPILFWVLLLACIGVTAAYIYVLVRDRAISARKFLWAQVFMPFGAIIAIWLVLLSTDSGLEHLGGPVDYIVLLGIAALGAIGGAILVYTVQSLISPPASDNNG